MIILDEETQGKHLNDPYASGLTLRYPEKAAARTDSSLPDYETSEARQILTSKRASKWWKQVPKLWRAVGMALGIYVLLSIIVGVPILVQVTRKEPSSEWTNSAFGTSFGWDENSDPGVALNVANEHPWLFPVTTHCDVDLIQAAKLSGALTAEAVYAINDANSLYIRSNITGTTLSSNFSVGHLTVDINPDSQESRPVLRLNVTASSKELLHDTNVCLDTIMTTTGLLFYVSRSLNESDFLSVGVQILLPQDDPIELDNLVTFLPWFSHTFGDLASHVTFESIILESSGYDVTAKSLKASKIIVNNAYGSIVGKFYATDGLTFDGIKSNITTNITLEYTCGALRPTRLAMSTGYGSINSTITVVSSVTPNHTTTPNYAFVADVETFNAPLNLQLFNAPLTPPVPVQLNVRNNDGNTSVIVDKNYQGSYYAHCKLNTVTMKQINAPPYQDPLGRGRTRFTACDVDSSTVASGWIGWGLRPQTDEMQGSLRVTSSLRPIYLQLGTDSY